MHEDETLEVIQERILNRVSDSIDKREGSIIYDATAPMAVELAQLYVSLGNLIDCTFADTAPREYLIRRAAERGLVPTRATYAVGIGVFTSAEDAAGEVEIGSRFSSGKYNWTASEKISAGRFYLTCEAAGAAPNAETGQLIPIAYIDGLETATLESIAIYGEDEEDTEVFRQRYFNSFNGQAFGGNKQDYYDKITSQAGVGGCKVYRATNEAGERVGAHVLAVITSSEHGVPSSALVSAVQKAMDPTATQEGDGLAPIGHICHIQGATGVKVSIAATITYDTGYSFTALKSHIEAAVDEYLSSLNETWDSQSALAVRISAIESHILTIEGIIDIEGTTLNGTASNLILGENEIALRGDISG